MDSVPYKGPNMVRFSRGGMQEVKEIFPQGLQPKP
jgi:hypothetical protein